MKFPPLASALLCVACAATPESTPEPEPIVAEVLATEPINEVCPRSGLAVVESSLTEYRGYVVGFCNTHCRDDFAAHVADRPEDRRAFDALIAALE